MNFLTERQKALLEVVKGFHGEQLRKYTGEPYWTHPLAVATILHDRGLTNNMAIEIALCHDLLEDTYCTSDMLGHKLTKCAHGYGVLERFNIIRHVEMLTDKYTKEAYPDWNRARRKQEEAESFAMKPSLVCTIKCADLLHNTESIVSHDPGFAKVYMSEVFYMLPYLKKAEFGIFKRLTEAIRSYYLH